MSPFRASAEWRSFGFVVQALLMNRDDHAEPLAAYCERR
jgi:hypothetical protein